MSQTGGHTQFKSPKSVAAAPVGMNLVRVDETYDLVTVRSGKLRDLHYPLNPVTSERERSVLLEAARTNLLTDPDAPATQLVSGLTNTAHTLSVEGSGSCEATGATTGSFGTASDGTDLTFTPDGSEDVTFTVTDPLDRFQCEAGENASSFIDGTRDDDALSFPYAEPPQEMTVYARFVEGGTITGPSGAPRLWQIGTNSPGSFLVAEQGGVYRVFVVDSGGFQGVGFATAPSVGDEVEIRAVLVPASGEHFGGQSINGGTEELTATDTHTAFASFNSPTLHVNKDEGSSQIGFNAFTGLVAYSGTVSLADCRTGTGTRLLTAIEDGIPTDGYTFTRSSEATELIEREAHYVLDDSASADAVLVEDNGQLVINDDASTAGSRRIRRIGSAAIVILD